MEISIARKAVSSQHRQRLHIARRFRRPDQWDPPIEPYDPYDPGEDVIDDGE
jgi:hypothetical protein